MSSDHSEEAEKGIHQPEPVALRHFAWGHLPPDLQRVSRPVGELAAAMLRELPDGPELTAGLRKLVEAKDCFVRAAIDGRRA